LDMSGVLQCPEFEFANHSGIDAAGVQFSS
jgi:hypothetical protein